LNEAGSDFRFRESGLVPIPCRGQELQPDGEGVHAQRFAVDHACPGTEITWKGVQVQPLVGLPGPAGNNAYAVDAHVFREGFLHAFPDIQAAEIDSYGERDTIFQALREGLHGTPLDL